MTTTDPNNDLDRGILPPRAAASHARFVTRKPLKSQTKNVRPRRPGARRRGALIPRHGALFARRNSLIPRQKFPVPASGGRPARALKVT
jgi:hypothetical protein